MTEKRYSLLYGIDENPYEWDIIDNEKNSIIYQSNGMAICNELNELNDNSKFLKIENEALEDGATKYAELCHKLSKENEQLKSDVYDWKASAEDYLKLGKSLKKENEELKTKNNAYIQDIEVFKEENTHLKLENEQLKQQIEELEFNLRTMEAYDRTVKKEHSDSVYDFKKKLEKW